MKKTLPTSRMMRLAGSVLAAVILGSGSVFADVPTVMAPITTWQPVTAPSARPTPTAVPMPTPNPTASPRATVAPTPRPKATRSISGTATWYCNADRTRAVLSRCMKVHPDRAGVDDLYAAAGPALRRAIGPNWRGTVVTVCMTRCVRVTLRDWCLCHGDHIIDLYRDALEAISTSRWGGQATVRW